MDANSLNRPASSQVARDVRAAVDASYTSTDTKLKPTLYLDLDGVLADFDSAAYRALGGDHYKYEFIYGPKMLWARLDAIPDFFENFPLMRDGAFLWNAVSHLNPIILTALPKTGGEEVDRQKRAWVARELGTDVGVITCETKDKPDYCKPGDALVDDRWLNKLRWSSKGGHFVHHSGAETTLASLKRHGFIL
ncbi:hypothetical protein [Mesorhizobium sp. M7A.F.Ca.CA.004.02.1.1]|uniref:hypothetical protein n=1 Tax=Mesorhizobium sp. M7A.F.Ca.CA.004.02.1.1 TaxID=2496690 RepID=UPI000FCBE0DD|nr:hypothetical protein [Mesorhizobium sp. M7A.F.Ca.CA.004.02.1.1]RVB02855.1 hypothetical protein EN912_10415 [Mesorhizobium sp. M7A.F.Ca.CA.004.02.1.1]